MFWKSKDNTPPLKPMGFEGAFGAGNNHERKVDQREQDSIKAKVFVSESRNRVQKEMLKAKALAEGYYFYGYFLSSMTATMLGSMALGSRIPFLSRYIGFISFAGGYGGAQACMTVHQFFLVQNCRKVIDAEVAMAEKLDKETGYVFSEYQTEKRRLESLLAYKTSPMAEPQLEVESTPEELAERYAKKMNWDTEKLFLKK